MEMTLFPKAAENRETKLYVSSLTDEGAGFASNHLNSDHALPAKRGLLRVFGQATFGVYQRIFLTVLIMNAYYAYHIITIERRSKYSPLLIDITTAASANMFVAIMIRQDYILNALFWLCWSVPFTTPLCIRQSLAKVYELGGLHSGTAFCSVLWSSFLFAVLTVEFVTLRIADPLIMVCSCTILVILWSMVLTSLPQVRSWRHNLFENFHRYGGWTVLGLYWVLLFLFTRALGHQAGPQSPGAVLTDLPAFWTLISCCYHVALPWMRLRRLEIQPERLGVGVRAIRLHLGVKVRNCVVLRISDSPLTEWHSFACIPDRHGNGGSLLVSNAGDWTRRTINRPKSHYYTRGIPTAGVLCMTQIFRKVILVTTGSGIGPCLGTTMNTPATKFRILWSAPSPRQTFGDDICDRVLEADSQAVVIDTHIDRCKNLVVLAYSLYIEEGAEAIFCVSNKALTTHVVYELGSRGIPMFGPIWDS